MSSTSIFNDKPKRWWHIWSCEYCVGSASTGKSIETREKILMAAFDEIYHRGFQAASLSNILKNTDTTKGALYHHFKNKMELGYAVVDEVIYTTLKASWIDPLKQSDDPIASLQQILKQSGELMTEGDISLGCPLNNLSQEMSSIDEGFQQRITAVYEEWQVTIEEAFERGKIVGNCRSNIDSKQQAILVVASLQGCLGLAKSSQSLETLMTCGHGLIEQLESLKPL